MTTVLEMKLREGRIENRYKIKTSSKRHFRLQIPTERGLVNNSNCDMKQSENKNTNKEIFDAL